MCAEFAWGWRSVVSVASFTLPNMVSCGVALPTTYPLHVVCRWIGNSAVIAARHYLTVTDAHFAKAACTPTDQSGAKSGTLSAGKVAQNAAQSTLASHCTEGANAKKNPGKTGLKCKLVRLYAVVNRCSQYPR
jgi:hypothetical protein